MSLTLVECVKTKGGRGVAGKTPVFSLLKHNGRVYTVIIPNAQSTTLLLAIRENSKN